MDTFHVDYLDPLQSTKKSYVHIFVVDAFSKFVWLYATKSTSAAEAIERLRRQSYTFGSPRRIVSYRGAFTSREFGEYCRSENVELITTGVPRANGQVERVNRTLIPLLTKLSASKPNEWYRYLNAVQMCLNATVQRSIEMTPFRVLLGIHPHIRDSPDVKELLEDEIIMSFDDERRELRAEAKKNIEKVQQENRKTFNKKRKSPQTIVKEISLRLNAHSRVLLNWHTSILGRTRLYESCAIIAISCAKSTKARGPDVVRCRLYKAQDDAGRLRCVGGQQGGRWREVGLDFRMTECRTLNLASRCHAYGIS